MTGFLINKNVCFYYWLKKKPRKNWALRVAKAIERITLIFGRDTMPYLNRNGMFVEREELVLEGIHKKKRWIE